jgi:hypothetical protein
MLRPLLRTFMVFALIGGLVSLTPTLASADDSSSARGAKKKKKKRKKKAKKSKKTKRAKKGTRTKRAKKGTRTKRAKKGTRTKRTKKGTRAKRAKKGKQGKRVKRAKKSTRTKKGGSKTSALVRSCQSRCEKKGKSGDEGSPCVNDCLGRIKKSPGNVSGSCRKERKKHCKRARTNKAARRCLSKKGAAVRLTFSTSCKAALDTARTKKRAKRANKTGTAKIFMPGSLIKSKVTYEVSEGEAIADGCIGLGRPSDLEKNYGKARLPKKVAKHIKKKGARGGSVISRADYLWPDGKIYYSTARLSEGGGDNTKALSKIRWAAEHITNKTVLELIEVSKGDSVENYVDFQWSTAEPAKCWSKLGMQGDAQPLKCNYNDDRNFPRGTIVHELLHAAGFNHTMKRSDRDDHITIHDAALRDRESPNSCVYQYAAQSNHFADYCFAKGAENTESPYDLGSILHYGSNQCAGTSDPSGSPAFTLASSATVRGQTLSSGDVLSRQRDSLTSGDVEMINEVYTSIGDVSTADVALYCFSFGWYEGDVGSRGAGGKVKKCLKRCGVGSALTKKGRAALTCRDKCIK